MNQICELFKDGKKKFVNIDKRLCTNNNDIDNITNTKDAEQSSSDYENVLSLSIKTYFLLEIKRLEMYAMDQNNCDEFVNPV